MFWRRKKVSDARTIIDNFNNRKRYTSFTKQTLESIPDDKLLQALTDYIADHVICDDYANAEKKVSKLSKGFRYLYALWILIGQVCNGGFNQFFYNCRGAYIDDAYDGALAIGADDAARIINGAVVASSEKMTSLADAINDGTLEGFSKLYKEVDLSEWDNEFFKIYKDLEKKLIQYIRSNIDQFITK